MKKFMTVLCLGLIVPMMPAQETNEVRELKRQMQWMQEHFEKVHAEDRAVINALSKKVDELAGQRAIPTNAAAPATVAPPGEAVTREQIKELDEKVDSVVEAQKKVRPSEFNPAIGLVGETVFGYRGQGSNATGSDRPGGIDVNMRSVELNVSASVDPFAKGWVVANASADSATGDSTFNIEEAAFQTTSLPWNLTLTGGRFFGEFGRLAYIHDHELPFVNRPLALDQYIGGESRTDGLQLNWLMPIDHYVSITMGAGDQFGGDSPNPNNPGTYRAFNAWNYWGRASTYFDLSPNWQLEGGLSGLWNPKTQDRGGVLVQPNGSTLTENERRVAGVDLKVSYVPLRNNQFRSFTWGTELLYSDSRYLMDPDGSLNPANPTGTAGWPKLSGDEFDGYVGSFGLYSYVSYKWSRQWSAGFLYDWVQNAGNHSDVTAAYSPFVTFALSHWNQLRLQYTHTDHNAVSGLKPDDAVYLQWAWIIGAHSHGWTQR